MADPIDLLQLQRTNIDACIRCGLCLSVCPTYQTTLQEEESPRGRIAMARAVAMGHLDLTPDIIAHQETCLLCEACTAICPANFRMEDMGIALRRTIRDSGQTPRLRRIGLAVAFRGPLRHMRLLRLLSRGAWLYQRSGAQWLARRSGLLRLLRLRRIERLLPPMPTRFFVAGGQRWPPSAPVAPGGETPRVGLFAGCVMSTAFAGTCFATARMLAAAGCDVVAVRDQGCCGALQSHSGAYDEARERARRTIDAFEREPLDVIAVNAAGCGSAMKGYGHLLAGDPAYAQRAAAFAAKVRDATELLAQRPLAAPATPLALTVTYQEPCHLAHAQRIREAPRMLLRALPGVRFVEMAESALCCGSAGVYNVTQAASAEALLRRKTAHLLATGADVVVTANPGCHLQLAAGLADSGSSMRVMHIIDLLDQAYGEDGR